MDDDRKWSHAVMTVLVEDQVVARFVIQVGGVHTEWIAENTGVVWKDEYEEQEEEAS